MTRTILVDVDNTLLDNDGAKAALGAEVERRLGPDGVADFWDTYEAVRRDRDCVDYLTVLERLATRWGDAPGFPHVAAAILSSPPASFVYPGAFETIRFLETLGTVVVLSDGDPLFQRAKIARTGLADAVQDRVVVTLHKEESIERVLRRYPATDYIVVDDKARLLWAIKQRLGERVCTVHVRQGHYADERQPNGEAFPVDLAAASIADVPAVLARAGGRPAGEEA